MMDLNMLFEKFDLLMDSPNSTVKMRKLILQLAVQGKLVEQDPDDEPASELLKRIKAEKEKLIAEGKNKKQKPLSPITEDEIPYKLPDGWESIRIGDAINMINGRAFKPSEWNTVGLPIIRIQNLNNPVAPYNYCDFDVNPKFHLKDGDFLISWSGTPGTSFGAFIWDQGPAVLNQHIFRCELYGDSFFRPYLRLAINAQLDEMISQAHGGVGLQHITKGKLEKLVVTLPPFAEQKHIVAKVEQLMQLCDQLDAYQKKAARKYESLNGSALEKLLSAKTIDEFANHWQFICNNFDLIYNDPAHVNKLRQAVLQLAIQGKLVPQDPTYELAGELLKHIKAEKEKLLAEGKNKKQKPLPPIAEDKIPYELPQSWEWVRLGNIVQVSSGDGLTSKNMDTDGTIPVYGGNGITGYHNKHNVNKQTIVIGRVGYYCGSIHLTQERAWVTDNAFITKFPETYIDQGFLIWLLKGTDLKKNENATAQPVISGRKIYPIIIGIPPLSEQKRIVAKVDQLMHLCDELETQLNQSKKGSEILMQAVLQEAFDS